MTTIDLTRVELVQSRAHISYDTVTEYAELMQEGVQFPPIEVTAADDESTFYCWDGCHRVLAARKLDSDGGIAANITDGDRRDAVLLAAGANATHGMRRTADDKRRAVQMLLDDPEWSKWSNREISRRCQVSEGLVRKMRPDDCVQNAVTYTTRHGTIAQMDTTNIGHRDPDPEPKRGVIRQFYVSANGRQFADYGHGMQCIGAARTGFPNPCPLDGGASTVQHCAGCRYYLLRNNSQTCCGASEYQLAPGTHFCHRCGRELSPYAQAQGWELCDGETCPQEAGAYALTDPDIIYPPAPQFTVPAPVITPVELSARLTAIINEFDDEPDTMEGGGPDDEDNEFETEAALIAGEDDEPAPVDDRTLANPYDRGLCPRCGQALTGTGHYGVDPRGPVCNACDAAHVAEQRQLTMTREELRQRAAASIARALADDNLNAWRLLVGFRLIEVLDQHDTCQAIRKSIGHAILNTQILGPWWQSETDVAKWFVQHNIELLNSLADLRDQLHELHEWIKHQHHLTQEQGRGNVANIAGLREAAFTLQQLGVISAADFDQFAAECANVRTVVHDKEDRHVV